MATSLADILVALTDGVAAINSLNARLERIFPQAVGLSTTAATAGAITFTSSQAVAFLSVQTSSGGIYKVGLYL